MTSTTTSTTTRIIRARGRNAGVHYYPPWPSLEDRLHVGDKVAVDGMERTVTGVTLHGEPHVGDAPSVVGTIVETYGKPAKNNCKKDLAIASANADICAR